ncbi:MAG: pyruvate ferredoxin oxidoreductase [Thermoplasmata archaeon]|nr:pyruvate ferredoxin oxidoreductase [Candidatus Sysuiplasma acidicola]
MVTELVDRKIYESEELATGTDAVAHAVRLADIDVFSAYPIRPYTGVMDRLAKFIADGKFDSEYIIADGEHSQFEIAKHASSVGARAFAGSSGTGWLYATEALAATATDRLPLVALVGNRALDDPGAFGVEHNDAMLVRDLGWLIVWASTAQEALDTTLIAYRVAEDPSVMMPCAVAIDGGYLTHSQHIVKIPTKEAVQKFLPPYDLGSRRMHPDNPVSIAPQINEDWGMEIRRQNWEAARRARGVIYKAYKEYNEVFKSSYQNPFFEEFMMEDAEIALIGMGTVSSAAKAAVKLLREKGQKVGYIKLRWFRPFPAEELRESLSEVAAIGVIDRDFAHGGPDDGGVLFNDVRSALYNSGNRPRIVDFIGGLAGREISIEDVARMAEITKNHKGEGNLVTWIRVREGSEKGDIKVRMDNKRGE